MDQRMLWGQIGLAAALALLPAAGASAQELGDLAGKAKLSDAERAKRDADKVYQWIRFNADAVAKPRPVPARPAAPATATATAATPAVPAVRPRPVAAAAAVAAPVELIAAPVAAASPASASAAAAAIAPALAAAASAAAPAPELLASLAASSPAAPARAPEPAATGLLLLERVEPEFPRSLLAEGRGGSVLLRLDVRPDGSVGGTEVLKASNRRLVNPVLQAVARWRFAPLAQAQSAEVEIGFRAD